MQAVVRSTTRVIMNVIDHALKGEGREIQSDMIHGGAVGSHVEGIFFLHSTGAQCDQQEWLSVKTCGQQ